MSAAGSFPHDRTSSFKYFDDGFELSPFPYPAPADEDEYMRLGETMDRLELVDDALLLSDWRTVGHQYMVTSLCRLLKVEHGLALHAVGVRLSARRLVIPDVVVFNDTADLHADMNDASSVKLVAEVAYPEDAVPSILKRACYAAAGIPLYLLIDQRTGAVTVHELCGSEYVTRVCTGEVELPEPVPVRFRGTDLMMPSQRRG
ncbi:Uma2 family endonuclease [Actinoplanes sp. RD1]|uniref:Uma2 family endonuclease n=1 Tax=Actinoplanes sp. RD1 TaxID=3064538 RepID=UPI0027415137|nr:Uma2 family endonuclease [Actinoplanes sp. RD1]